MWRRFDGDDWAAYGALPPIIRRRLQEHAYDAWAKNAFRLWRGFHRQTASRQRAERRLLNYLDLCEALEREAFSAGYAQREGGTLPHLTARVSPLRYHGRGARPD